MNTSRDWHVVFGTGPLGRSVMSELLKRGARVRMVNRSGKVKDVPQGVEVAAGNAYDAASVRELTRGAAVVYQCAQPNYWEWPERFPPLQAAIIEGVASGGAKLVIGENLYMYGDTNGQPVHEGLPHAARGRKGRTRAQMAEAALAAHRAGKVRVAIGRGSDFFGPHAAEQSHIGARSLLPALAGKPAQLVGNPDVPHTFTYIEDFGKALVILGERDEALGQAWHVPNPETVTQRQLMTMVFEEIGRPPAMSAANRWMLMLVAPFVPAVRELLEMMYEFEKPYIVDSSKFERAFGIKATPLREAIRRTVAWYRPHLAPSPQPQRPGAAANKHPAK
jgi:nucleoside-diphosphate-sugar epimerase